MKHSCCSVNVVLPHDDPDVRQGVYVDDTVGSSDHPLLVDQGSSTLMIVIICCHHSYLPRPLPIVGHSTINYSFLAPESGLKNYFTGFRLLYQFHNKTPIKLIFQMVNMSSSCGANCGSAGGAIVATVKL